MTRRHFLYETSNNLMVSKLTEQRINPIRVCLLVINSFSTSRSYFFDFFVPTVNSV